MPTFTRKENPQVPWQALTLGARLSEVAPFYEGGAAAKRVEAASVCRAPRPREPVTVKDFPFHSQTLGGWERMGKYSRRNSAKVASG